MGYQPRPHIYLFRSSQKKISTKSAVNKHTDTFVLSVRKWQNETMPKIIGSSLAEHRTRTRDRLFEALSELMEEHPFESITMSQIASSAKVGRTAVYNHFEDKESLLLAFITHETARYAVQLKHSLRDVSDPVDQLRVYIRSQLELGSVYHLAPGTNLRQSLSQGASKELHSHATMVENILHAILGTAMEQGRIPKQNPTVLISLINSALAGRTLPADHRLREYLISATQIFILRGIGVSQQEIANLGPIGPVNVQVQDELVAHPGVSACPVHRGA